MNDDLQAMANLTIDCVQETHDEHGPTWTRDTDKPSFGLKEPLLLARAYLVQQETNQRIAQHCRYILGTCKGETEMMEEAHAILRLLGQHR